MNIAAHTFKTRLAPTPSGYLHLGNILSFVVTQAVAQRYKATVLLRIDDMDRERAAPQYIEDIFTTLRFLDIPWNEGPDNSDDFAVHFAQHHRLHLYKAALQHLIDDGQLFACTCSRAEILRHNAAGIYPGTCLQKKLPLDTPNSALRLKTPAQVALNINTPSGVQSVTGFPASMQHFVVRKKDGMPAYQLSSLVDDLHFGVNLIVRGADLWHSTLAQWYLATLLQATVFTSATFVHHPLLVDAHGGKLSKSAGANSVFQMRNGSSTKADVFTAIGNMLQVNKPLYCWQDVADAMQVVPGWMMPV